MKLANLSSNIMALVVFYLVERLSYILDLQLLFFFSIAGHYVGSGMVMKNGNKNRKTDYSDRSGFTVYQNYNGDVKRNKTKIKKNHHIIE